MVRAERGKAIKKKERGKKNARPTLLLPLERERERKERFISSKNTVVYIIHTHTHHVLDLNLK